MLFDRERHPFLASDAGGIGIESEATGGGSSTRALPGRLLVVVYLEGRTEMVERVCFKSRPLIGRRRSLGHRRSATD